MWIRLLSPLLILAMPTAPAHKNCHRCTNPCPVVEKKVDWRSGFEVVAGFRWDRVIDCPTYECPKPVAHQDDPFFLGLQQRLPLNEYFTLQGRLDRDVWEHGELMEKPHWNGAVQINWAPMR